MLPQRAPAIPKKTPGRCARRVHTDSRLARMAPWTIGKNPVTSLPLFDNRARQALADLDQGEAQIDRTGQSSAKMERRVAEPARVEILMTPLRDHNELHRRRRRRQ